MLNRNGYTIPIFSLVVGKVFLAFLGVLTVLITVTSPSIIAKSRRLEEELGLRKKNESMLLAANTQLQQFRSIVQVIRESINEEEISRRSCDEMMRILPLAGVVIYMMDPNIGSPSWYLKRWEEKWKENIKVVGLRRDSNMVPGLLLVDHDFKDNVMTLHSMESIGLKLSPDKNLNGKLFRLKIFGKYTLGILLCKIGSFREIEISLLKDVTEQIAIAFEQSLLIEKELQRVKELQYQFERNALLDKEKKEAEMSSRLKSDFLATMSHEIRTPMNAIVGYVNLLLDDTGLTDEQRETIKIIDTSSRLLLSILNDILDYSKIESGYLELEQNPFSIQDCIENSIELLYSQAEAKKIDLNYFVDEDVPLYVLGDQSRLRQILVNLLSNAVKFTEKGGIVVIVTAKNDDNIFGFDLVDYAGEAQYRSTTFDTDTKEDIQSASQSSYSANIQSSTNYSTPIGSRSAEVLEFTGLNFHVIDSGIGIPADRIGMLFRKFTQVDSSISRRYGGTGLGLAISAQLSRLMSGGMWVKSTKGKGSVFTFCINVPIAKDYAFEPLPIMSTILIATVTKSHITNLSLAYFFSTRFQTVTLEIQCIGDIPSFVKHVESGYIYNDKSFTKLCIIVEEGEGIFNQDVPKWLQNVPIISYCLKKDVPKIGNQLQLYKPIKIEQCRKVLACIFNGDGATSPKNRVHVSGINVILLDLKILVVDDNAVNRKMVLKMLNTMGIKNLDVACDGFEAVEKAKATDYDVILMDISMPGMDGLTASKIIIEGLPLPTTNAKMDEIEYKGTDSTLAATKASPSLNQIDVIISNNAKKLPWIVAMTASAMVEEQEMYFSAGMNDFIAKPLTRADLTRAFDRLLKSRSECESS